MPLRYMTFSTILKSYPIVIGNVSSDIGLRYRSSSPFPHNPNKEQLFTEVEVNSGGYLPSLKAAR